MSAATVPAIESLEALDFDAEIPCESKSPNKLRPCPTEPHPADWWFRSHCRGVIGICDADIQRFLRISSPLVVCATCGQVRINLGAQYILGPVKS